VGQRLAEKDPYGFLAVVLADIDGRWKDALAHRLVNGRRSPRKLLRARRRSAAWAK